MGKHEKLLEKILSGQADYNIAIKDLIAFLLANGFTQRTEGNHMIFTKEGVRERINLQSSKGQAKGYQVKQVREIFAKHKGQV